MPFTTLILLIFLISIIFLIIGFVTRKKILKNIAIIFIVVEVVYFIMIIKWIEKMWFSRLIRNFFKDFNNHDLEIVQTNLVL